MKSEDFYNKSGVDKEILTEIINLFVVREKCARFLEFIESKKRYDDFLSELLNDARNFKPECLINLPGTQHTPEGILQNLNKSGAGSKAYLLCDNKEFDGATGNLDEILSLVGAEYLVYCLNSRLAYYVGHNADHYILRAV